MSNKTLKVNVVKIKWVHRIYTVLFLALACVCAYLLWTQSNNAVTPGTLSLNGNVLNLEIADTEAQRVQGLSGRNDLNKNSAMLFIFPGINEQCMWMKDMKFPLDMVWLDENKQITKISENITPDTYPQTFCGDAKYVLEVSDGVVKDTGLETGQNLNF